MAFPHDGKKFSPGESGNPGGRPKKLPQLDALLEKVLSEEKDGITAMEAIIMKLRQQATGGNIKASEILIDRAFGKAKQAHEVALLDKEGATVLPVININLIQPKQDK